MIGMARKGLAVLIVTLLFVGLASLPARADTGGYPYADYSGPGTDPASSVWTDEDGNWYSPYRYVYRNCTDYVAWKLDTANGWKATNAKGTAISIGNAKNWKDWASGKGYAVDNIPAIGAVAWWDTGTYGHVAYVESVGADTVTISEYNRNWDGNYSTRTIKKNAPTKYIHFKDRAGGGDSPKPGPGVTNATYRGGNQLTVNMPLYHNQYIMSEDGMFVLLMQSDGNLVLYGPNFVPIWGSNTVGRGGGYVVLQPDGNLVMYSYDGRTAIWSNDRPNTWAKKVVLQPDGNFVAYNEHDAAVWGSGTARGYRPLAFKGGDRLGFNQGLYQNQYIRSADGTRFVLMQSDGNLVMYGPGYHVYWTTDTGGTGAGYAVLQPDSNFVLYMPDGHTPRWGNGQPGSWGTYMVIQKDGNFVEYTRENNPVWASNTGGRI